MQIDKETCQKIKEAAEAVKEGAKEVKSVGEFVKKTVSDSAGNVSLFSPIISSPCIKNKSLRNLSIIPSFHTHLDKSQNKNYVIAK